MIKITGNIQTLTNILNAFRNAENKEEETATALLLTRVNVRLV